MGRGWGRGQGGGSQQEEILQQELELELELIQTHMTQKPVLRVEAGARALRMLVKKHVWLDRKGKCGCARHLCVGVGLWRAGHGGMGM